MTTRYDFRVATVLVVSDLSALRREVRLLLESPQLTVVEVSTGREALTTVKEQHVDLAILDLQVTNMGAMAICMELRHEESYGAADYVPVLMLLDRRPDVFLAKRCGAEGFVLKPLDPQRVRRAVRSLLDGSTYDDPTGAPPTVAVDTVAG